MVRSVNVSLEGAGLTPSQVQQVARYRARVTLSQDARKRLQRARAVVDGLVDRGEVVYGLNTGVGALRTTKIAPSEVRRLQRNLVRSHAVGVGPLLEEELVRAGMLVRVNQFCQGSSGVRPEVDAVSVASPPQSQTPAEVRDRFRRLAAEWKQQSRYLSNTAQMAMLRPYQRIIGIGLPVVPLILQELRHEPDQWFWALEAITDENPVPPEAAGNVRLMAQAWVEWGVRNGLIAP